MKNGTREKKVTHVCTSFTLTVAAGVLGLTTSESAMKAATANATVVKKPKTFWMRVMEVCILFSWPV